MGTNRNLGREDQEPIDMANRKGSIKSLVPISQAELVKRMHRIQFSSKTIVILFR